MFRSKKLQNNLNPTITDLEKKIDELIDIYNPSVILNEEIENENEIINEIREENEVRHSTRNYKLKQENIFKIGILVFAIIIETIAAYVALESVIYMITANEMLANLLKIIFVIGIFVCEMGLSLLILKNKDNIKEKIIPFLVVILIPALTILEGVMNPDFIYKTAILAAFSLILHLAVLLNANELVKALGEKRATSEINKLQKKIEEKRMRLRNYRRNFESELGKLSIMIYRIRGGNTNNDIAIMSILGSLEIELYNLIRGRSTILPQRIEQNPNNPLIANNPIAQTNDADAEVLTNLANNNINANEQTDLEIDIQQNQEEDRNNYSFS